MKRKYKHSIQGRNKTSPPGHEISPDQSFAAEAGCVSLFESLSQVAAVYPNTLPAAFSSIVKWAQDLIEDQGCSSSPDKLSHEFGV